MEIEELSIEEFESVGSYVAWYCGDTFIQCDDMTPVEQWERIVDMLQEQGFYICEQYQETVILEDKSDG